MLPFGDSGLGVLVVELVLLRHGQSEGNVARIFQGQMDFPLTELGRQQARDAGKRLEGFVPDAVIASPLTRAWETARLACPDAMVLPEPAFCEICLGRMEGLRWEEAEARFPEEAALWLQDPVHRHPPGGESGAEVYARTGEALEHWLAVAQDKGWEKLLLVAHYQALVSLLAYLTCRQPEAMTHFALGNACMARVDVFDGAAVLKMLEGSL